MDEQIPVTVKILDRTYRLRIGKDSEQSLRQAAELIDTQAGMYGKNFAYQDHQDLLAMVALSQTTELVKMQDNLKFKDKELIDKLAEVDSVLESHLHPAQDSL